MTGPTGTKRPKVVIIGGGFAGLYTARTLANTPVDVVLIDRKNHHTFQPLLYQVAAGVLAPGQIAAPLRTVLRGARNAEVLLAEVIGFHLDQREVSLKGGQVVGYDYLVVAAGARHSYFGRDEWAANAPGLKTLEDAVEIRRRLLTVFEEAESEAYLTGKAPALNFAIVGAGPTGVEIAGILADIARRVMAKEFRSIDTRSARVLLFEASPHVLGAYPESLSIKARQQLESLGVEVFTGKPVTAVEAKRIRVGDEWIPVCTTIWATGVAASPLGKLLGVETDRAGRVPVEPDCSLKAHPEVFVLGDMASLRDTKGQLVPALGAAAMQMGRATGRNILREIAGKPRQPFVYTDKGTMATIGKHRAVAEIGSIHLSGFIAWILWGIVHVFLLIGFRSRLAVMREWAWTYLTEQVNCRLITSPEDEGKPAELP